MNVYFMQKNVLRFKVSVDNIVFVEILDCWADLFDPLFD